MGLFSKNRRVIIWTPVFGVLVIIVVIAAAIVLSTPQPREDMKLGVTFSLKYAEELGVNWKDAYDATLDELGVRYLRIPIYWDMVEPEPGRFDFSEYDYMIQRAEEVGAHVIVVIGRRQPRWPECHVPSWAEGNSESVQQVNIRFAIDETVNRFRNSPAVVMWQVDNEPLLQAFGECPPPDIDFIHEEIELVRLLDPTRPVMVTESGELSTWTRLADVADVVGVSMYRITWNEYFGYWYYPLGPQYYRNKALLIKPFVDRMIISELQAEPWFSRPISVMTLEDQYHSMNPELLERNVDFARRTGFDEAYLWGVEWWYWLKVNKNQPDMWEMAKEVLGDM